MRKFLCPRRGMYSYDRVAATETSLMAHTMGWAEQLATSMADRFTGYGGWANHRVKTETIHSSRGVSMALKGAARFEWKGDDTYPWSAFLGIDMKELTIHCEFSWGRVDADVDPLELLTRTSAKKTLKIDPAAAMQDVIMPVSLWLSEQLNVKPKK
jgi:hypothetical protein